MSIVKVPIIFCNSYQSCGPIKINLPFGIGAQTLSDPCCTDLDLTLGQFGNLLAPLLPFLNIIGCVTKLVEIVLAIPDAIGPPPSVSAIGKIVGKITTFMTKCIPMFLSFIPGPNPIPFCQLIRDLCHLIVAILSCIRRKMVIFINLSVEMLLYSNSPDPDLRALGLCLAGQNDSLMGDLLAKLGAISNLFDIINLIIGLIPPLALALQNMDPPLYPLSPFIPGPMTDTKVLDDLISVFQLIQNVANICAGGS